MIACFRGALPLQKSWDAPLTAAGASPGSNDTEISRSCNSASTTQTHHWPEGIPVKPALGENPDIEKKRAAGAVAQPFLTSGDSIGFGLLARSGCQTLRFFSARLPTSPLRVFLFSVTCRKTSVIGLGVLQAAKMDRSYISTALPPTGNRQTKLLASEEM